MVRLHEVDEFCERRMGRGPLGQPAVEVSQVPQGGAPPQLEPRSCPRGEGGAEPWGTGQEIQWPVMLCSMACVVARGAHEWCVPPATAARTMVCEDQPPRTGCHAGPVGRALSPDRNMCHMLSA